MSEKKEILREVRNLLKYHEVMEVREVPTPQRKTLQTPSNGAKEQQLKALEASLQNCTKCRLCQSATNLVFGVGNPDADLMFVGEGPGRDEDLQGEPFVGRAGQLLTKIIEAMGCKRSDVYIGNCVKHRPPNNRTPADDEMEECLPFLLQQIDIVQPRIIVCLGAVALKGLLKTDAKISQIRGTWQEWRGIKVMPTFHPAFLLRNPNMKKQVWEDMQKVMKEISS